jgi:hypothetical protein
MHGQGSPSVTDREDLSRRGRLAPPDFRHSGVGALRSRLGDDTIATPAVATRSATVAIAGTFEVRNYARSDGQILFATDVGYLNDYDPTREYNLTRRAGLTWREILASLTTSPAARFHEHARRGRVARGLEADLVVFARDPRFDVGALADVRHTIRGAGCLPPPRRRRFGRPRRSSLVSQTGEGGRYLCCSRSHWIIAARFSSVMNMWPPSVQMICLGCLASLKSGSTARSLIMSES